MDVDRGPTSHGDCTDGVVSDESERVQAHGGRAPSEVRRVAGRRDRRDATDSSIDSFIVD